MPQQVKGEVFEFFFSLCDSDAQFDMGTAEQRRLVVDGTVRDGAVAGAVAGARVVGAAVGARGVAGPALPVGARDADAAGDVDAERGGRAVVSAAFPEREAETLALLLASNDGSAVTTPAVAEFTRRLSAVALDFAPRVVFDLEHYYSYNEELPSIAEAFVSHGAAHNRTHMLLLFTLMTHKTQVPLFVSTSTTRWSASAASCCRRGGTRC